MSIVGNAGASNGWQCESQAFSTDDYDKMRLTLSGSANAQYYVDVMDLWGNVIFARGGAVTAWATRIVYWNLPQGSC